MESFLLIRIDLSERPSWLGAVHKRRPQSEGEGGLSSADLLRTREEGFLQRWTSALFGAKIIGFFEIYGVSSQTRGVEPVRTFYGQWGGGQFFYDFVRTSFMDDPLSERPSFWWYLDICPKNDVILFNGKGFCALGWGLGLELGLRLYIGLRLGLK